MNDRLRDVLAEEEALRRGGRLPRRPSYLGPWTGLPWTPREDAQLRALAGKVPAGDIARAVGRPEASVRTRARILDLDLRLPKPKHVPRALSYSEAQGREDVRHLIAAIGRAARRLWEEEGRSMRKTALNLLVLVALAWGGTANLAEAHSPESAWAKPCHSHPTWWKGPVGVKHLIHCLALHYEQDPADALAIASCETGGTFSPPAYPGGNGVDEGFGGPFQQALRFWPDRLAHYADWWPRGTSVFNARANSEVSLAMAREDGGWRFDWAGCAARLGIR